MNAIQGVMHGPEAHGHLVQFYKADEPLLNRNVASFLWDGLLRGDGLLVVATRQRCQSLASNLERLGADVGLAREEGQLTMLDAEETLSRIMVDSQPDWDRFQSTVEEALQLARPRGTSAARAVYGEMVGVLWEVGQTVAAIRLEQYWNQILEGLPIRLFCGYPIDVLADGFQQDQVRDVLCAHTHVLSTSADGDLGVALHRAVDELLGPEAESVRSSMTATDEMASPTVAIPEVERAILWLRSNLPEQAERILDCARRYFQASQTAHLAGHAGSS